LRIHRAFINIQRLRFATIIEKDIVLLREMSRSQENRKIFSSITNYKRDTYEIAAKKFGFSSRYFWVFYQLVLEAPFF
jgi:hypothetical protein